MGDWTVGLVVTGAAEAVGEDAGAGGDVVKGPPKLQPVSPKAAHSDTITENLRR